MFNAFNNNLGTTVVPVNVLNSSVCPMGTLPGQATMAMVNTTHAPVTCLAINVQFDAKGEYRISKRLQRVIVTNEVTSQEKREILDVEITGVKGSAPSVTLNGLPLPSDQCLIGIDGIVTILDVERNIVDRIQLPVVNATLANFANAAHAAHAAKANLGYMAPAVSTKAYVASLTVGQVAELLKSWITEPTSGFGYGYANKGHKGQKSTFGCSTLGSCDIA